MAAVRRLDDHGGFPRWVARSGLSVAVSVRRTVSRRALTTVMWSGGRWWHRWPEGRVVDERRWSSPSAWATHGTGYDLADLLWRDYRPMAGDVVIDIGAGNGGETFHLAGMVGTTGRVVAVEAATRPFRRLEELCRINSWPHVEPVHMALSHSGGEVTISDVADWVEGNIFDGGSETVPATTLDELCSQRGITHVAWVKMNIEGAERDALIGAESMAGHVDHWTIACHDFLGPEWARTKDFVTQWLQSHGFIVTERGEGEPWESHYLYASRG